MWHWLTELDRVLRGEATRPDDLREGTVRIPALGISIVILILGVIYGLCMGCFTLLRGEEVVSYSLFGSSVEVPAQFIATTVKVPALFFLTLLVTFPSLYVFNALVGSRLYIGAVFRLLIAALAVNLAVLASLGPIVAFFSICTASYPFMVLLNVFVFSVAGMLGLFFLLQTLHRLTVAQLDQPPAPKPAPVVETESETNTTIYDDPSGPIQAEPIQAEPLGALDRIEGHVLGRHVKTIFRFWVVIFGLVGAQMGWVLRPFVGDPGLEFTWFRARGSNFFEAVIESFRQLFGA